MLSISLSPNPMSRSRCFVMGMEYPAPIFISVFCPDPPCTAPIEIDAPLWHLSGQYRKAISHCEYPSSEKKWFSERSLMIRNDAEASDDQ